MSTPAPSRLFIFILAALSMLGALSIDAYLPALPAISQSFTVTPAAAQQTLSIYLLAFAGMTLFYGTLSDSFGRRPVIVFAMIGYILSSIGAGMAVNISSLLFFRFLQGLTAGAGNVISRAIIGDLYKGAEAQRIMSYTSVVFGLAPAIAPILGGWLLQAFGWRSIFGFIALFAFLLLLLVLWRLPETLPVSERHPFHFRPLLLNYIKVASHASFMLQSFGMALAFSGVMLYVASAPEIVLHILHLPVTQFGWLFIPLIGGMTAGSALSGKWSHRYTPDTIIRISYILMGIAATSNILYNFFFPATVPWAIIPLFIYSFGMSLAMPTMSVRCLELFPERRGLASSLQNFIFMIIFAFASGVVCPLLFDSLLKLAFGTAVGFILSLLCWFLGNRSHPQKA